METKQQKIKRLKESQERLKEGECTPFNLRMQQEALRKGLLLRKPIVEDKRQKQARIRESQRVARDLELVRRHEERERKRVIEKLRKESKISNGKGLNSLFFPRTKRRRR